MKTFNTIEEGIFHYLDKYHCLSENEENLGYMKVCVALNFLRKINWVGIIPQDIKDILKLHSFLIHDAGVYSQYQGYGWKGLGGSGYLCDLESSSSLAEEVYEELRNKINNSRYN